MTALTAPESLPTLPHGLTTEAARDWSELTALGPGPRFDPATLPPDLPEPTRRWIRHAVAPGTPLFRAARLEMTGAIRLGQRWHHVEADQVLAPGVGYVWAARTHIGGLPVAGFDRYHRGVGEMHWRVAKMLLITTATGDDVTASAAGRLAGELGLLPTAYHVATWVGAGPDAFIGRLDIDGRHEEVRFRTGPSGHLQEIRSLRWGNPLGEPYGRYPFGMVCHGEQTFGGLTIPHEITAGWFIGSDRWDEGEFFRVRITSLDPIG